MEDYPLGSLLNLENAYLQDDRFSLVLDGQELKHLAYNLAIDDLEEISGALVDIGEGDYIEVWTTVYRRPYALGSIYERKV